VGGRSLTWGRQSYRLSDLDFEANARVPEFIVGILNDVYLESETVRFVGQLSDFSAATTSEYGMSFDKLDDVQQDARLSSRVAGGQGTSSEGASGERVSGERASSEAEFFEELRQLTVYGYYTSELGATSEHALTNYMAPWNGDIDYADVGRMWTG
jgi:hypothetical protein